MPLVRAYIGLGANVGDSRRTLAEAVAALGALPGARLAGVSHLYRTAPVGVVDQPDFHNAVVGLDVRAPSDPAAGAVGLLVRLKRLEREAGRRVRRRWGPRELDLDLLLFGDARLAVERPPEATPATAAVDPGAAARLLEVPHPSMHERLFVLAPLADLAPDLVPPGWDETVAAARRRRIAVEGDRAVAIAGTWSPADQSWVGPSGRPIEVRRATAADADEIARVHSASAEAAYRDLAPPDPGGLERRTRMWRELLANPAQQTYVATDRGRIVGVLDIGEFRDDPATGAVRVLYVLPAWWGSGAAQLLLDLAHAELAKGFATATLTVLAGNGRARRFYERNGWEVGVVLVEPHFGGRPTEVARYHRRLR